MRRKTALLAGWVLTGFLIVLFLPGGILSGLGDYLVVADELGPVDVIHVLSGPDSSTAHALRLYQQGYAADLFFSGGWCESHQVFHGAWGRQNAIAAGVPAEQIGIDDSPMISTYEEAEALKRWIDASPTPIRAVMVVSDPYHMRRAQWTFRQVLGKDVTLVMAPVPFGQTSDRERWWTDRASTITVGKEYVKMAYYLVRYKYSRGWFRDWLASLNTD